MVSPLELRPGDEHAVEGLAVVRAKSPSQASVGEADQQLGEPVPGRLVGKSFVGNAIASRAVGASGPSRATR
jgi:hypothetical protein